VSERNPTRTVSGAAFTPDPLTQARPAAKRAEPPRGRRMKAVVVQQHITAATKLYAVAKSRFGSLDLDYICRFFDTLEDAQEWAAKSDEPCAIFLTRAQAGKTGETG